MAESDLNKTLERLGTLLTTEVEAWEKRTRAERHRVMERVSTELNRALDKKSRREARREAKEARRAARRQEERDQASFAGGAFGLIIAAFFAVFALTRPDFWWMVFVALGVGASGARQIGLAAARNRALPRATEAKASAPAMVASAQSHEIDQLCDQLLADLKASPEAVRSFLQNPEKTVEALRATSKALDVRRGQLAAEDPHGRLAALATQRTELTTRIDAMVDPVARTKLQGALGSLDGQESALRQLLAAMERVDGEYTSLLILLQELKTRVALARSTSTSTQLGGLQQSVARLNAELAAITDSLEAAPGEGLVVPEPIGDVGGGDEAHAPARANQAHDAV